MSERKELQQWLDKKKRYSENCNVDNCEWFSYKPFSSDCRCCFCEVSHADRMEPCASCEPQMTQTEKNRLRTLCTCSFLEIEHDCDYHVHGLLYPDSYK